VQQQGSAVGWRAYAKVGCGSCVLLQGGWTYGNRKAASSRGLLQLNRRAQLLRSAERVGDLWIAMACGVD
jgi:hypothetical protein